LLRDSCDWTQEWEFFDKFASFNASDRKKEWFENILPKEYFIVKTQEGIVELSSEKSRLDTVVELSDPELLALNDATRPEY
jgi:hypothetical protein